MRAVQVSELTGPEAARVVQTPEPSGSSGLVEVDVAYAGVSFPDLLMTRGLYQLKEPPPFVPGVEAAGTVRVAPAGSGFTAGDRVAVLPRLGAWAEVVVAEPDQVFALPDSMTLEQGAGVLMNTLTAHFALVERARLVEGETVLVHGAAGGTGTAAIQVARGLGAQVIAVVSTEAKAEVARAAGAHHAVLADGWLAEVRSLVGRAVDVVFDPVGGDRVTDSLRCLRAGGRLLVIGFTGGPIPSVALNRLLLNNIGVLGAAWGEYASANPGYSQRQWAELAPLLASGAIDPVLGPSYPLEQAADALRELEDRRATGKVTLQLR